MFAGVPSYQCPDGSPLLRAAEQLTGTQAVPVAFGTEAPFLAALGMDVVIMGPGNIALAHQPDEYVETAALEASFEQVRKLIAQFCT
jgi:acetylornithine deacetylase